MKQLKKETKEDYYICSLSKSRNFGGTELQPIFNILSEIYMREGDRWIEVVRRIIASNYNESF